jgi:hypothetical protein
MKRFVVCALLLVAGCHGKQEAVALVSAVDAYRAASNDDKPRKAAALDAVRCTDKDVCDAKDACRRSADATAKGLRLQAEIQSAIADGGKPDPDTMQKKFEEANSELAEGYGFLDECRTKVEALKQHYSL